MDGRPVGFVDYVVLDQYGAVVHQRGVVVPATAITAQEREPRR